MQSYYNISPACNPPRLKTFVINLRSCAEGVSNADRGIKTSMGISLRQLVLGSSITLSEILSPVSIIGLHTFLFPPPVRVTLTNLRV